MIPGVPALAELGYPDIDMTQWFAAYAPPARRRESSSGCRPPSVRSG